MDVVVDIDSGPDDVDGEVDAVGSTTSMEDLVESGGSPNSLLGAEEQLVVKAQATKRIDEGTFMEPLSGKLNTWTG